MENNQDNIEKEYEININLQDVLDFIRSDKFNLFLLNNTTISNGLFISEVLEQTIKYMTEDIV